MTTLELYVTLLASLGEGTWLVLEIDQVEWTNPRYHHQN